MRIGIDCRLWNESGVGRYVRNLVKELFKIDHKNEYVLFVLSKDLEDIEFKVQPFGSAQGESAKFKVVRVDIRWHTLREQIEFTRILNKENLDLVHFPYFSVPIFYDKPFVVTIHDLILHHFPTGQASTLPLPIYYTKLEGYKFVISQAAKKAKKIIAVSKATKSEIMDHLDVDPGKVEVIYEGVENLKLKTQNSKLHLKTQNYFLYVGNVYPHKNVERLLEAFKQVKKRERGIKLVLVGKEDYFYKRLKKKVHDSNLQDNVLFFHDVGDRELAWLYKNAIALVAPSLMEGFGLSCLEAMAAKCLVLASDIPSFREVCANSAIYFKNRDAQDIADSMKIALVMDKKNKEMRISRGVKKSQEFSWKIMAERTLEIYKNAA